MKCILLNLNLPHTKTEDLSKLNNIVTELFIKTFSNDNEIPEIINFLMVLQKETSTQNKWIREVLNGTIQKDLKNIRPECEKKAAELFTLRCHLIQKLFKDFNETPANKNLQIDGTPSRKGSINTNGIPKYFHDSPLELRGKF